MTKRDDNKWWMDRGVWIICALLSAIGSMVYGQLSDISEAVKPIPLLALEIRYNKADIKDLELALAADRLVANTRHDELKKKIQSIKMELSSGFSILGVK